MSKATKIDGYIRMQDAHRRKRIGIEMSSRLSRLQYCNLIYTLRPKGEFKGEP